MCDIVSGQLIICHHQKDVAAVKLIEKIKNGEIGHVEYQESLLDKLESLGEKVIPNLDFNFHLIRVPEGQEVWKINYLQFFYKHEVLAVLGDTSLWPEYSEVISYSNRHLLVGFNNILTTSTGGAPALSSDEFQFTDVHNLYKKMIGVTPLPTVSVSGCRIKVLDTGISPQSRFKIVKRKNLTNSARRDDVTDDHRVRHGTVVCSIIADIAPNAELLIYKVADQEGHAVEWDVLAALILADDCDIINMSLQFGLHEVQCPHCGRASHSSRSVVFERIINHLAENASGPIIVAAAGNRGEKGLLYPARFHHVLAVAAINSSRRLSSFSNYSAFDETGRPHPNLFLLPGGEKSGSPLGKEEHVMVARNTPVGHWGTSCAAAYASGALARLKATPRFRAASRSEILEYLQKTALKDFAGYDPQLHGNGVLVISPKPMSPGIIVEIRSM